MNKRDATAVHARYMQFYKTLLSDIRYIKYEIYPELEEPRQARSSISKIREAVEKEGKNPVKDEKLKLVVRDIISHRFQSNLVKFKMLQQQEILRGLASGGISPEDAILILLDQTTGEELEEKVLSKGKVSPQSMDELYKFYTRIGEHIERLSHQRVTSPEASGDSLFFRD
jgi:hypothetical protein